MKRFSVVLITALSLAVLSFAVTPHSAAYASCTPNWHVAQSATINRLPPVLGNNTIGSISLLRDGCGDIQASLTITQTFFQGKYSLTDANTNTVIWSGTVPYPSSVPFTQTSPIFAGYGGIGVFASGTIFRVGVGGSASTATDYGN